MIQDRNKAAAPQHAAQVGSEKRAEAIAELLLPAHVVTGLSLANKKQVFQHIAQLMAPAACVDEEAILNVMWEREQLGSTAVGGGLAIPHGRISGLTQVQGCFLHLAPAVAFGAADEQPVDLVFALLSPATAGADHLHALGLVAGIMRPDDFRLSCRRAQNAATLHKLLVDEAFS